MTTPHIDGNTAMMSAFSQQLTAPQIPPSLVRLGMPPNLSGLFEGIAMSLLDKAATAEISAYLTKVTEEMVTYSQKVGAAAATYKGADLASTMGLVASTAKLAEQGIGLAKQVAGMLRQHSTELPGEKPGETPNDKPGEQQPDKDPQCAAKE